MNRDKGLRTKTRVQLDLSPTELDRMNESMAFADLETRKDLFNNALSLFEWAIQEVRAGNDVGSLNRQDNSFTRLTMPALSAARSRKDEVTIRSVIDRPNHEENQNTLGKLVTTG